LIAAREAVASRARTLAVRWALAGAFAEGGPWRRIDASWPRPAWPAVVACGLGPAAADDPEGPWAELEAAWEREEAGDARWSHPAADAETRELFAEAAGAAAAGMGEGRDEQGF
jgi:hypothetical protein